MGHNSRSKTTGEMNGNNGGGGQRRERGWTWSNKWYIYMKMSEPNPIVYTMNMSVNLVLMLEKAYIYSNMKI